LKQLVELMGDLCFPGAVIEATDPAFQSAVWNVRKEGLNIMMSMKGDGKPVSFIEDCAVRLEDLAEYTDRLTRVFEKHGTYGTWYAHASVGCLHVRPVLNLKQELEVKKMRAIAEEAFAMVREYKGSHSGEHGDGLVRSEFHEAMFGSRMVRAFEEVKDAFDPQGLFNPGKIVRAPKMDDRSLFRFKPDYRPLPIDTALDWSEWGGFAAAAEMCNNNGACRARDAGVMCPSWRATGDEQHLTRGRANSLRLALTGQLGPEALVSEDMRETMALCISCKGCKRECPTGVDMARMKIEFLHHYRKRHGLTPRDRLIAYLPRYAPYAARVAPLMNLRNRLPMLAKLGERRFGLSADRKLPRWSTHPYRGASSGSGREVVLLVLLRSAMPAMFDTLRITLGWAWTYLVVAELVAANSGLVPNCMMPLEDAVPVRRKVGVTPKYTLPVYQGEKLPSIGPSTLTSLSKPGFPARTLRFGPAETIGALCASISARLRSISVLSVPDGRPVAAGGD